MPQNEAFDDDYRVRVLAAKRDIANGVVVSDPMIAPYLIQSWQRSHDFGLKRSDRLLAGPDFPQFIIDDADREFATIVGHEIDVIWESFGGEHWAAYCTNARSIIIRARHGANPASRSFALHVGRRIEERDVGTTAPACALRTNMPVTLVGPEHYLDEFADMFCCAAPVWGPWGKVAGVLNVTGSETFKSRLVEHQLQSTAMKTENRLFLAAHQPNTVFKIHYDAAFIDTHLAGLIAVNAYGDVLAATRNGLQMLDPTDVFNTRCNVADLFADGFVVTQGYCLKTRLRNGVVFYTKACGVDNQNSLTQDPAVGESGSMRDRSAQHVLEVVRQCGGNISQAARVLGLSRTTLYRVLKNSGER
ncbi:helix-turn-helix domain-containing protein [Pseudomonas syringae]|uniref:helix-turn-helix domain-containing protein n=1 Tax=Pseudomonas syringae TaxID=317 RepID=UPI001372E314